MYTLVFLKVFYDFSLWFWQEVIADISDNEDEFHCSFHTEPDDDMFESEELMSRKQTTLSMFV